MNVLFIDPASLKGTIDELDSTQLMTPNMGLIYMATYLKSKTDAEVVLLDASSPDYNRLPGILKEFRPSLVAISAKTFNILSAYKLAGVIKNISPKTVIIAGGAHPTALPDVTLAECPDIDAAAVGEGENTLYEVYQRLKYGSGSNRDFLTGIPGIVYRDKDGQILKNPRRELISDLDTLPFSDFSIVDYKRYRRVYNYNKHKFQHIFQVFGSRGCPFNCVFCMPLLARKHRKRRVENILAEIEWLNKRYRTKRVYFGDSLFFAQKEAFIEFCDRYSKKGLHKKVQWGFETRIDVADKEMFKYAKKSGCIYTFFGVESGNERVLEKSNKGYAKTSIIEKVSEAKQAGIDEVNISIILGLPCETKASIEETFKMIEELPCSNANINILDVYPGTNLFEMADKGDGGLRWIDGKRMNWSTYFRNDPMVTVNDLSSGDLLDALNRGRKLMAKKARQNKKEFFFKRLAYTIEYAGRDRQRLYKKIADTFKGLK